MEPTLAEFRARFPEFANVPDSQVQQAIDDASCWVDTTWLATACHDCATAMAFLAAHYLAMGLFASAALPETLPPTEAGGPVIVAGGQVTSLRFESMGVSFSARRQWAAAAASSAARAWATSSTWGPPLTGSGG